VIPDSAAGLLALFGCVAPGLVFQLRRERFTPQAADSTMREAARIALTSLIFTAAAAALISWLSMRWRALPDVEEWLSQGSHYLPKHYMSVAGFLALIVTIACGLALLSERLTRSDVRGHLRPQSVWFLTFRNDKPEAARRISLWITTEDGTQFRGALRHFTPEVPLENRELALGGSALERLAPGADPAADWVALADSDAILIPGTAIKHIVVSYLDVDNQSLRAEPPRFQLSLRRRLAWRLRHLGTR
jgi:hypothetical protein